MRNFKACNNWFLCKRVILLALLTLLWINIIWYTNEISVSTKGTPTYVTCLIYASFVESLVELKIKAPVVLYFLCASEDLKMAKLRFICRVCAMSKQDGPNKHSSKQIANYVPSHQFFKSRVLPIDNDKTTRHCKTLTIFFSVKD